MNAEECSKTLANNFMVYLSYNGITISEASRKMNISRETLTNIYYGKNKMIKFETLETLADFMGFRVYELFMN